MAEDTTPSIAAQKTTKTNGDPVFEAMDDEFILPMDAYASDTRRADL